MGNSMQDFEYTLIVLQSFENNLFRAPVYAHVVPETDFLVIASGDQLNIRDVRTVFVVGQECPKVEVPAPNSKAATQTQKELLQVSYRENSLSMCPGMFKINYLRYM